MNRIQKDPSTGEWFGIVDDDCVVVNKDPEYVAGYLAAYNPECKVKQLALAWKNSGYTYTEKKELMLYLESLEEE